MSIAGKYLTEAQAITLSRLACEVAIAAPERFSIHGSSVYIPRELVKDIRQRLDDFGIDWRALQREARRIAAERRNKSNTETSDAQR